MIRAPVGLKALPGPTCLRQSSKQPQGGRLHHALKAQEPLSGSREAGRSSVGLVLFLLLGFLGLCACSLPITLFFISAKPSHGIGWWPMGYDLWSSGPQVSPSETYLGV